MDDNLIRLIIETGGTGVVILGIVWLITPLFSKWLDNLAQARRLDAEREQNELDQSRKLIAALNGVESALALSRDNNQLLATRIGNLPTKTDMEQVGATMRDWANEHGDALSKAHQDVKTVNEEIVALRELITQSFADLDKQLKTDSASTAQACDMLRDMQVALQRLLERITPSTASGEYLSGVADERKEG